MLVAFLLAQVAAPSAIDAERAFEKAAQTAQWKAFRDYSTPDAVMFVPEPVVAHRWLATAKEPTAKLTWRASDSFVSCDGRLAVNTGTWMTRGKGPRGYFTTIWARQADGRWKWIYDGGDALATQAAAPPGATTRRAACAPKPDDALGAPERDVARQGEGRARDATLQWRWTYTSEGARALDVYLWNGTEMERVVEDRVDPPAPRAAAAKR